MKRLALPSFLLALALPSAAQTVLVVDDVPGPGVDHTSIQDAASAAPSGAILLVRPGNYGTEFIVITGKSLTIEMEPNANVTAQSTLFVQDLGPGDEVVVRGLEIDALGNNTNELLQLEDNLGTVWIEGCTFLGTTLAFFTSPDTVLVSNTAAAVFRDCTIVGGAPAITLPGGRGIAATGSSLFLFDTVVEGGPGTGGATMDGSAGGPAVQLEGGLLFADGSDLRGGDGGSTGAIFGCGDAAGDGGDGLVLGQGAPQAFLRNTALAGGAGGEPLEGCASSPGAAGAPSTVSTGSLQQATEPGHGVTVTTPVRTDELATVAVSGPPGEFAVVLFAPDAAPIFLPGLFDTLVPASPLSSLGIGQLDGAGNASLQVQPTLPPGVLGRRLFTQVLFFDAMTSTLTLGAPNAVVVLDASL